MTDRRTDPDGIPLRVLLIEDSEDDAQLVLRELHRGGFAPTWTRVDTPAALVQALEVANWDVVISDHAMPQFSSMAALALVRLRSEDVPFLIVSGTIDESQAVAAMKAGAQDYLTKDKLGRLTAAVEREIGEAEVRRARREAEQRRLEAEERYRELVETIPAITYSSVVSPASRMLYISPQVEQITGVSPSSWTADDGIWNRHLYQGDRDRVLDTLRHALTTGSPFVCEYRLVRPDGRIVWLRDHATIVADESAGRQIANGFAVDITQQKEAEATIRHMAYYDRLTELPNRWLLEENLTKRLRDMQQADQPLALLLVRIHRLKEINNTLGHTVGDSLLQKVARRLMTTLGHVDLVARLDGEKFALVLASMDAAGGRREAQRVLDALTLPCMLDSLTIEPEAHVGIAVFPGHGDTVEILLRRAAVALNTARQQGVRCAVYSARSDSHTRRRLTLMSDLRRGIEGNELLLQYQPQIHLPTGQTTGVEALVRWHHPRLGLVAPGEFIELADQSGLIQPLTRWVLNEALRQWRLWQREGIELAMSVNISARNLLDPQFESHVLSLLETWGVPARFLCLEITESSVMQNAASVMESLRHLRNQGVQLSIDDFGTGYSSIQQLRRLPFTELKVDRSFLTSLQPGDDAATEIIRFMLNLGHGLALRVVVEGVEQEATLKHVQALGCDAAQGYYMSAPLDAAALKSWLDQSQWGLCRSDTPREAA
jgi:diguanylate cyclase (GGDEF)-like protein/PAS domain S-box-containing protein